VDGRKIFQKPLNLLEISTGECPAVIEALRKEG
jgi:hypothetical protein